MGVAFDPHMYATLTSEPGSCCRSNCSYAHACRQPIDSQFSHPLDNHSCGICTRQNQPVIAFQLRKGAIQACRVIDRLYFDGWEENNFSTKLAELICKIGGLCFRTGDQDAHLI